MIIDKIILTMLIIISLSTAVYAIDLPPTVIIDSNPQTQTEATAIITVIATDLLDNAGIFEVKLYDSQQMIANKTCGFSTTCVLTKAITHNQPIQDSYYATAIDKADQSTTSRTINISYLGVDTPPAVTQIPDQTILEDLGMNQLEDLWDYAVDEWTADENLTFTVSLQTNTSMANCLVDNNRYLNCTTVDGNATGTTDITIRVSDGRFAPNITFELTVENVNDIPELIQTVPNLVIDEDTSNLILNLTQYFKDIDGPNFYYEFVSDTDYLTALDQNEMLNLTALHNYYGIQSLTIIASDGLNQTNTTVNVTINPVNDIPYFSPALLNQTAVQYLPFTYDIDALDFENHTITYTDNSPLFAIDPNTGLINFTPLVNGTFNINITVCDNNAAPNCDTDSFVLEIIYIPAPGFFNETPLNMNYTEEGTYDIFITIINASAIDTVLFSFNAGMSGGGGPAIHVSGNTYKATLTNLSAGTYSYNWFANYTNTISNNSQNYTFTILPATLEITMNVPDTIEYGTFADINCTTNTNQAVIGSMYREYNSFPNLESNPHNTTHIYSTTSPVIGIHNYTCNFGATQNYTAAINSAIMNITPKSVVLNLSVPSTIEYGTWINASCTADNTLAVSFARNGTPITSPDLALLSAGHYNYTCAQFQMNHEQPVVTQFATVTKKNVNLSLTGPSVIEYGTPTNVSCSTDTPAVTPVLYINGANVSYLYDNTAVRSIGYYNYTCVSPETVNHSSDSKTIFVNITKLWPVITLTINGTETDINILGPEILNVTGIITTPIGGVIQLYINNTLQSSLSLLHNFTATIPVKLVYPETENYTYAEKTFTVTVGIPPIQLIKTNFSYPNGTHFNNTWFTLTFNTNINTTCRWAWNDTDYDSIDSFFTFSRVLSGQQWSMIVLPDKMGWNNISISCINETAATNTDLQYHVDNIIRDSNWINSNIYNSYLQNTTVDTSTLQDVTADYSLINNSQLTNCNVINSTVRDKIGSNCNIVNSFVDPSEVHNSNITSNSNVTNSTVNNSNIIHSTITNSNAIYSEIYDSTVIDSNTYLADIEEATVTDSKIQLSIIEDSIIKYSDINYSIITSVEIRNSTIFNSTIDEAILIINSIITNNTKLDGVYVLKNVTVSNSTISTTKLSNTIVQNANIDDDIIYNGTIQLENGSIYDADTQGPAKISDLINQAPTAAFVASSLAVTPGTMVSFNASTSTDSNTGGPLGDSIVSYSWEFGDNSSNTGITASRQYNNTGSYVVKLTVTDSFGLNDTTTQTVVVSTPASPPAAPSGGGGGGGGGGSRAFAKTYAYDLDSGMHFQQTITPYDVVMINYKEIDHVFKMLHLTRDDATLSVDDSAAILKNAGMQKYDLDGDHYYDMEVAFLTNNVVRAEFRIRPVQELIPGYSPFGKGIPANQVPKTAAPKEPIEDTTETPSETTQEVLEETQEQGVMSKFWAKAKSLGAGITGAVVGVTDTEEIGGATGLIILLAVVILGIFLYWIYNEWF